MEARLSTSGRRVASAPQAPEALERMLVRLRQPDIKAGWPPQFGPKRRSEDLIISAADAHLTLAEQHRAVSLARKHPEVARALSGRCEVLGCHMLTKRPGGRRNQALVEVVFCNYTTNVLIEVLVLCSEVISVNRLKPFEHPESPLEMAQAISLARAHPELGPATSKLEAHAILRVPPASDPDCSAHRCILVMFTEPNYPHEEQPVLYSALVDLTLQTILRSGETPCGYTRKARAVDDRDATGSDVR